MRGPNTASGFPEYYERDELWPPESLARRRFILPLIESYQAQQRNVAHKTRMTEQSMPILNHAAPVLASLDIARTVEFYCSRLGFTRVYVEPDTWGIVARDMVQIHFWACPERHIAENTSCRVYVSGIDELFHEFHAQGVIHPNAPLQDKPWGSREFGVLDEDGNLITFAERAHA